MASHCLQLEVERASQKYLWDSTWPIQTLVTPNTCGLQGRKIKVSFHPSGGRAVLSMDFQRQKQHLGR